MKFFVEEKSIVREIWGKGDSILFIFAGSAAEFALNKAVDWLYYTGRLPSDPLGRLFSTVKYARLIIFSDLEAALHAIDKITAIHKSVEKQRNAEIPDWAYRDVLFMLIDYSIRSYEILERQLLIAEKEEVFNVFYRVGERMGLAGLPKHYEEWLQMRESHLNEDLVKSKFTEDLYGQYKKHLGFFRFRLLLEGQILVVPEKANALLNLGKFSFLSPVIGFYKLLRMLRLDWLFKLLIFPFKYKQQIRDLDIV
ncbi:MAG: oxygenase MpaB family protein [Segetibacter sp.]